MIFTIWSRSLAKKMIFQIFEFSFSSVQRLLDWARLWARLWVGLCVSSSHSLVRPSRWRFGHTLSVSINLHLIDNRFWFSIFQVHFSWSIGCSQCELHIVLLDEEKVENPKIFLKKLLSEKFSARYIVQEEKYTFLLKVLLSESILKGTRS